ncbi:MAG: type II toxin-antitoxin system VapC family toxin [Verrucomicrobiales bacterium]|nr:type II toxin-antitoxin system VapC family toxin [Verrucomicrobiales bacterium]
MSYLVDTNIWSEPARKKPDPRVTQWLRDHESELYVSSISIGEIRRGIERLPTSARKTKLHTWLQSICDCMKGRVLSFNTSTAHVWGQLKAKWDRQGIRVPSIDSQIAATAHRHGLVLVTRNVRDFQNTGIKLLNPFTDPL